MKLESLIKTGLQKKPPRIVLHGIQKVGKSTFAAQAPNPVFLITEDGLTEIDVPHFPLAKTVEQVWTCLDLILQEDHEYKTLVVDTIDWLEKVFWKKICEDYKTENIEEIGGGWQKGYNFVLKYWDIFFEKIDEIRDKKNMAIILLAHNEVKNFTPPDASSYDRYQIKLHKFAAAKAEEWADAILFANFKVYVDGKKKKAVSSGERLIYTTPNPAWRAGNRYSLPEILPLDFNELLKAIKGETNNG